MVTLQNKAKMELHYNLKDRKYCLHYTYCSANIIMPEERNMKTILKL